MEFTKMQGIGNDYVYVDCFKEKVEHPGDVRAKALKLQAIYKAFALTGRLADCHYTQGAALG